MRIPADALKDFVDVPRALGPLAERLTRAGLETTVSDGGAAPGGAVPAGVVVAEVRKVARHPNADRLTVCEVFDGEATRSVVCGAPNVREGIKAPLAKIGTELPGGRVIERAVIRGVASEGMLCSEKELGLGEGAAGIMILPETVPVGGGLPSGQPSGPALEVDVTPNRGDCLSVLGVAREVGALLGKPVRLPRLAKTLPAGAPGALKIEIRDRDRCSRYVGVLLDQVTVGPSPDWLAARLREFGVRSINNVVDITNLVLMELGQPLHAFDADVVRSAVTVRRASAGETLVTLDGVRRNLADDDLVIADAAGRPVALAGVMGGAESGITGKSTRVLLEAAWFEPRGVRRAAMRHGCPSESSARFERGVDPDGVAQAARRAVFLLTEHAGARAVAIRDVSTGRHRPVEITLRSERVERLLGISLQLPRVRAALQRLGFKAEPARGGLRVSVPSWRSDVAIEPDLVEEVARFIGYDEIPSRLQIEPVEILPRRDETVREAREALLGLGFNETMPLGFTSREELERLRYALPSVRVTNPLSQDQELLPPTILPGLLRVAAWNRARQVERVAIFEIGTRFLPPDVVSGTSNNAPREIPAVAAVWSGPTPEGGAPDVLWIKGMADAVLSRTGVTFWTASPSKWESGGPGRGGHIEIGGKTAGVFGELSGDVAAAWGLEGPLVVLEVSLAEIMAARVPFRYVPASPYPAVDRDLAFVLDAGVSAGDAEAALRDAGGPALRQVKLFDVYQGAELGEGKKSLAFRLRFQSQERTLNDAEAREAVARIVQALAEKFGAALRG